ncbi:MAG: hypothetical protein OER86_14570 [Phycisphaerae bacterium]|nr:hypothetical protein [Phycisphaerae bacterium]
MSNSVLQTRLACVVVGAGLSLAVAGFASASTEGKADSEQAGDRSSAGGETKVPSDETDALEQSDRLEPDPDIVGSSEEASLLARLRALMNRGPEGLDDSRYRGQLDQFIVSATELVLTAGAGPLKRAALNLQMQGLYLRITRYPDDPLVDRLLAHLRASGRQALALDDPEARVLGDFWLMTCDLFDLNRSGLAADKRREQTERLLRRFVEQHPGGPAARAARATIIRLRRPAENNGGANGPAPVPNGNGGTFRLGQKNVTERGVVVYPLTSPFQSGVTSLRVLVPPEDAEPRRKQPVVVFVLPVEAGRGGSFGDVLGVVAAAGLHRKHNCIFVAPVFSQIPWYVDHPAKPSIRQQTHMIEAVVPAIDRLMAERGRPRRLLLGFGSSGWGAVHLLLSRPDLFDGAAAWDAPLMIERPTATGMDQVFASQQHFQRLYLPRRLRRQADVLRPRTRLALLGYSRYRAHMQAAHELLKELEVGHEFADGPQRPHHWGGGWIEEAVASLVKMARPRS